VRPCGEASAREGSGPALAPLLWRGPLSATRWWWALVRMTDYDGAAWGSCEVHTALCTLCSSGPGTERLFPNQVSSDLRMVW